MNQLTHGIEFKEIKMALIKTLKIKDNFDIEIDFQNAYIKIDKIIASKELLKIQVSTYRTKDGTRINSMAFDCGIDLNGKNFIAQAYDYIKTVPEFTDAIDC
jgi:hypothetical protein